MIVDETKQKILEEQEHLAMRAALESKEAAYIMLEKCNEEDFFCGDVRRIFKKMIKLHEEMQDITLGNLRRATTAQRDLLSLDNLTSYGDANPLEIDSYISFIKENSKKRKIHDLANEIRKQSHEDIPSDRLVNTWMQSVIEIERGNNSKEFQSPSEFIDDAIANIRSRRPGTILGYTTGLPALDVSIQGYEPGNLILIASRPGMGKTLFALQGAVHLSANVDVAFFSLEMTKGQLTDRMISNMSKVNHKKIRMGDLDEEDWKKIGVAVEGIKKMSLHIDDTSGASLAEVISKTKRLCIKKNKIGPIFVDYLNKMTMGGGDYEREEASISRTVGGLKDLAKDLNVPVILLAQLNRNCENRDDKRPQLSDLRGSGALEQEADIVIFPYRHFYYEKDPLIKHDIEIIVAKNRHSDPETVKGKVFLDTQRIEAEVACSEEEI